VLDVAAGTGNVAIRAAEAGTDVVASDITVENMKAGKREASERGVELEWVEADAQALPFDDGDFDVVTSSAGAMFAPDQQAVADELLRVCRPGGTIGMANFTPNGLAAEFFGVLGPYLPPPPPDAPPPLLWGAEAHVRELFGDRVSSLEASERELVETVPGTPAHPGSGACAWRSRCSASLRGPERSLGAWKAALSVSRDTARAYGRAWASATDSTSSRIASPSAASASLRFSGGATLMRLPNTKMISP
jgi:SAM-dependent methyltransferase